MIEIKREKTAQPTISADDIHYDAARRSGKASALTDRLGSVQKSDVFLSQSYRSGPPRNFAFRLRNALRRSIARSCRDNSAQDTELAEGIAEGKALYLQAESLRDTQNQTNPQPLPLLLRSKMGLAMGAAVMLSGTGLIFRAFSQHGRSDTAPVDNPDTYPDPSTMENTPGPTDLFNSIAWQSHPVMNSHRHNRRHLAVTNTPATIVPKPDVSKRKLYDFSCAEERKKLSFSDVLRNIADTLKSPMKKTGEEWQVFYNYEHLKKGCPEPGGKMYLLNIMHYIDIISQKILHSFPRFIPLMILQNLFPPVLKSIADRLDGKEINVELIIEINREFLSVTQMLSASLDLHSINLLSTQREGAIESIIPEKLKIRDGFVSVEVDGSEFKMNRDQQGVYIYDLVEKDLFLKKKYINYNRGEQKWQIDKESIVMSPEATNTESVYEAGRRLISNARDEAKTTGKYPSSAEFIAAVLTKSGLIKDNIPVFFRDGADRSPFPLNQLEEVSRITNKIQLLQLKAGNIVIFIEHKNSGKQIEHAMLATGNGLFTGIHNEILADEFSHNGITLTAEQLGEFTDELLISSNKIKFKVLAGLVKSTKLPFFRSYKDAVMNLDREAYNAGSVYAIGSVLSRTGDISPETLSVIREGIPNKVPIRSFIKAQDKWMSSEDFTPPPPGNMIFLTQRHGEEYESGIFALRLNEEEFFIPELIQPALKIGGGSTIYKLSELEYNIKERELWVKSVGFDLESTRVQALLGKDARFYAFGNILHMRAHGLPMTVNYMSPLEIANVIKSLAIIKKIDLNKIETIVLESCFGAAGYPSIGKSLSAILNKKVTAYRGKYRTGYDADGEAKVTYHPTPLSQLEILSASIAERNINFIRKIRGIYSYLKNTFKEPIHSSPQRPRRSTRYFSQLLIDLGRLVLGRKDTETFIQDNYFFYGRSKNDERLIHYYISKSIPDDSMKFFEMCMNILYISQEATSYLDFYLSTLLADNYFHLGLTPPPTEENKIEVVFNKNITTPELIDLAYTMGISTENMYLAPKKWHDFGFPGDIFINKKGNKYFEFRKTGLPSGHFWKYPPDTSDDENWLYAGRHPGTLEQPKDWYEYGKPGSVFYGDKHGYYTLKTGGRPSDHQWFFPQNGQSDMHWEFITWRAGTFKTPRAWEEKGIAGNVYYSHVSESFFILKKDGEPSRYSWHFPGGEKDDADWIYAGKNQGTLDNPKKWNEYGKVGSVYYQAGWGYMSLTADGRPSDNLWFFPNAGESNQLWVFICYEVGSFKSPKLPSVEGTAGEVYYAIETKSFYILRKDGKPLRQGWLFPAGKTNDGNWIYAGQNPGTLESPKSWKEYGKAGSVYHQPGVGYFSLRTEGCPSEHKWKFPNAGKSNKRWKLISWEQGSFNAPKQIHMQGKAGEVYYSDENQRFYILKSSGNSSINGWLFPSDEDDDENWIYAGKNIGTFDSPKSWNEYGKAGLVYHQKGYGFLMLKTEGRPSDNNWKYPKDGKSDKHWKFISWDKGSFDAPKRQNLQGKAGEVYYSDENESFYILRNEMTDSTSGWYFPSGKMDNDNWFYAGRNRGTLDSPKIWDEYGKAGSVYYRTGYGYLTLISEGRPPDNKWYFPPKGESNNRWKFITMEPGSFKTPRRLQNTEGIAGEVYYSEEKQFFYILRSAGRPLSQGWHFPADEKDDTHWICAGRNRGTPESPKAWTEYGKKGSLYHDAEVGYLTLKSEGRPSEHSWSFPTGGEPNEHWEFISYEVGSFNAPKHQGVKGTVGEVYYDLKKKLFYILKKEGIPLASVWSFPSGKTDNAHWIYGGENSGTLDAPKNWHEYGKPGSVYFKFLTGYLTLKTEGRPSDHNWHFPDGTSNEHWKFISWEAGSFTAPKMPNQEGIAGEVYYSDEYKSFYILRKSGNPSICGWHFPPDETDDANWFYAGDCRGTLHSPKHWAEYGKAGSVYYLAGYGFLSLKTAGRPSDNQWTFPAPGRSDQHWEFISFKAGTYTAPKRPTSKGTAGEVYYCFDNRLFYILRREGTPSLNDWDFPSGTEDNWYWLYGGENRGTLADPKSWGEYGKVGSVYYKSGYGYHILQTEGNPSVHHWYFPPHGESNDHWKQTERW